MPEYPTGAVEVFAYEKLSAVTAITDDYNIFNAKPSQDVDGKFIYFEVPIANSVKVVPTNRIFSDCQLRVHVVGTRQSANLDLYAGVSTIYSTLHNQQFSANSYGEVLTCVHEQDISIPYDQGADFTPRTVMEFRVQAK